MKKEILIVTDRIGNDCINGSEYFCSSVVEYLEHTHNITVLTRNSKKKEKRSSPNIIEIKDDIINKPTALINFLKTAIDIHKYDLIYNLGGLAFGSNIVRILDMLSKKIPIVNHFQAVLASYAKYEGLASDIQAKNSSSQRIVAREAVLNIFPSLSEYQMALKFAYDLEKSIISIIPNGVEPNTFKNIKADYSFLNDELKAAGKRPIIIFTAGRFSDYVKGADLIYRAFVELYKDRQDIFLLSISDSNRFEYVLQDIPQNAYKIMDWLPKNSFFNIMAASNIVVLPSRYEPFGMIAIEAMMLAKPVVANSVGGLQETIYHNHTGIINNVDDGSFGIYKIISKVLNDLGEAQKMGKVGKEIVMKEYCLERINYLINKALLRALATI